MLGAHLLVLVSIAAAGGLGLWQWHAWQLHRDAKATNLTQRDPVPLTDVLGPNDAFPGDQVGQPVEVSGAWLPDATVFISGRPEGGTEGYWVVTPVGLSDGAALPVVRGWVADPAAVPAAPTGSTTLVGWLQPSEGGGLVDDDPGDDVFPELRVADLVQRVDQDLYGAYAVAAPTLSAGVNTGAGGLEAAQLEQLPDVGAFTAIRNLLYAIEWWFFGAFAVFVWWRFVVEEAQDARTPVGTVEA